MITTRNMSESSSSSQKKLVKILKDGKTTEISPSSISSLITQLGLYKASSGKFKVVNGVLEIEAD